MTQDVSKHPGGSAGSSQARAPENQGQSRGRAVYKSYLYRGGKADAHHDSHKFSSAAVSQSLQNMGMMNGWGSSLDRLAEQVGAWP